MLDAAPTRLEALLRTIGIQPAVFHRRANEIAKRLGMRGISRAHLYRIRVGAQQATEDLILLVVMTLRDLTGLPVTAGQVFNVEPVWRAVSMPVIVGHPDPLRGAHLRLSLFSPLHRAAPRSNGHMVSGNDHELSATERLAQLYEAHASLLVANASFRHGIPPDDVEALVHDVFASYLEREPKVDDPKAYLIAAVNNACLHYWRKRRREAPLLPEHEQTSDDRTHVTIDKWEVQLLVASIVARLGHQCRETLRRFYFEEQTLESIAAAMSLSLGYVYNMIGACRKRAREVFVMLRGSKR